MTEPRAAYDFHVGLYNIAPANPKRQKFPLSGRFARQFVDVHVDRLIRSGQELLDHGETWIDYDFELAGEYQRAAELLIDAGLARIVSNWIEAGCPEEDDWQDEMQTRESVRPSL